MSAGEPRAARDTRLEAPGAGHPGVRRGPFDLMALESTRQGLKLAGFALAWILTVVPLVALALPFGAVAVWGPLGNALGLAALAVALALTAPTPNGPLPLWLKRPWVAVVAFAAVVPFLARMVGERGAWTQMESATDGVAGLLVVILPWILWRFCQHRGLTGRALVWLWIALALTALGAVLARDVASGPLAGDAAATPFAQARSRGLLVLLSALVGVAAFDAARRTARDMWLDAVHEVGRRARARTAAQES